MAETEKQLAQAEAEIARVLAALEKDTDSLIESIELFDTEVTTLNDDRQQLQRRVVIKLRRNPGSNWHTGDGR